MQCNSNLVLWKISSDHNIEIETLTLPYIVWILNSLIKPFKILYSSNFTSNCMIEFCALHANDCDNFLKPMN